MLHALGLGKVVNPVDSAKIRPDAGQVNTFEATYEISDSKVDLKTGW